MRNGLERLNLSIFGESHGAAIGMVLEGIPAGEKLDLDALCAFLARRAPGKAPYATARRETDLPQILSGIRDGVTEGSPICMVIPNKDMRSSDYDTLKHTPRPGHADYTAQVKYGGAQDARGGGHFSGRLTAPLCAAGGICLQLLQQKNIFVGAHIASIAGIEDRAFDPVYLDKETLLLPGRRAFATCLEESGTLMQEEIQKAAMQCDSVGGVIECGVIGMPAGFGGPLFEGVEGKLSLLLFGIPAVKGVEFGDGFALAGMRGSEANDPFALRDGRVVTKTNRCGGILGGITDGMPLIFRAAFKPTPSIAQQQQTVDLKQEEETALAIQGRHDPCIVPRAVPCVEAAAALCMLDLLLCGK